MDARAPDDVATIRDLLTQHLPDLVVDSIGFRGEGLENVAYDVNSEFILRISKEDDPDRRASLVAREAELLGIVAPFSQVPIPAAVVVADTALMYRHSPAGRCWTPPGLSRPSTPPRSPGCSVDSSPRCTPFRSTW